MTGNIVKLIHLAKADIDAFSECAVWNGFIELLSRSEPQELCSAQRPAQRGFWYDAEVQNGGHLQYFLNRGIIEAQSTVSDLRDHGAAKFNEILVEAISIWKNGELATPESVDKYVELATEGEFDQIDATCYSTSPSLTEILEEHLNQYQNQYVCID